MTWRESVAAERPPRFKAESYWARPVPGFGDPDAGLLVVGLAPAAHGGNRTGRIFTGDRSGDWLFRSLHRAGFANQPTSVHRDDGLSLSGCYIAAAVRCAPPGNRPLPDERDNCLPYLLREVNLLKRLEVIVALGSYAWQATLVVLRQKGVTIASPRPVFGHGAEYDLGNYHLLGSYHPSQQNTFTGKLTEQGLDDIFGRARHLLEDRAAGNHR